MALNTFPSWQCNNWQRSQCYFRNRIRISVINIRARPPWGTHIHPRRQPPSLPWSTINTSPVDGKNLNRIFPGIFLLDGTLSEQIAHFLVSKIYPHANYVLDVHSRDADEQLGPSYTACYSKVGSEEVIAQSRDVAIAFGLGLVIEFQGGLDQVSHDNNSDALNAIWVGSAAVV